MNTKLENSGTCEVRLVIRFLKFIRRKFAGRLATWIVKVQWTKGIWGNGVGCSKKGRQCATARRHLYLCLTRTVQAVNCWAFRTRSQTFTKLLSNVSPSQEIFGRSEI